MIFTKGKTNNFNFFLNKKHMPEKDFDFVRELFYYFNSASSHFPRFSYYPKNDENNVNGNLAKWKDKNWVKRAEKKWHLPEYVCRLLQSIESLERITKNRTFQPKDRCCCLLPFLTSFLSKKLKRYSKHWVKQIIMWTC